MNEQPLVTIAVITYQSEKTIVETLDSAAAQTWKNLELIISDDGSTDNTVLLCKEWISRHKDRFVRTELITVENNTGIPANCNRMVRASHSDYIKYLAGDDIFLPTCIEDNMKAIGDADLQISQYINLFPHGKTAPCREETNIAKLCNLSPIERAHFYARSAFFVNIPTLFVKKRIYEKAGMYDESEPLLEDVPFMLKAFASEAKMNYLAKPTVIYRLGGISTRGNRRFDLIHLHAFFKYRLPYLNKDSWIDRMVIKDREKLQYLLDNYDENNWRLGLYYSRFNYPKKWFRKLIMKI